MLQFESVHYFLLLIFLFLLYFLEKKGQPSCFIRSMPFEVKGNTGFLYSFNKFLKYLVILLLVTAMANPVTGEKKAYYESKGVNIVLALDTSGSMRALDMDESKSVSRLEALKDVASGFVKKREGDRIGISVFGSNAFTLLPLTRDYKTVNYFIDKIHIGMAGENTAVGDAIAVSAKRLKDIKSKTNIIILVTDGESNSGELPPLSAAQKASLENIKIYTIGIGHSGYAPFPARDFFGREVLKSMKVNLDDKTLKQISSVTDGLYFNGKNKKELEKIYSEIDKLEKTTLKTETFEKNNEFYLFFLLSGFFIFLLTLFLSKTRFTEIP